LFCRTLQLQMALAFPAKQPAVAAAWVSRGLIAAGGFAQHNPPGRLQGQRRPSRHIRAPRDDRKRRLQQRRISWPCDADHAVWGGSSL